MDATEGHVERFSLRSPGRDTRAILPEYIDSYDGLDFSRGMTPHHNRKKKKECLPCRWLLVELGDTKISDRGETMIEERFEEEKCIDLLHDLRAERCICLLLSEVSGILRKKGCEKGESH